MTQEQKELLLKDLSSRFPYGVKIHAKYIDTDTNTEVEKVGVLSMIDNDMVVAFTCDDTNCYNYVTIHEVKPYLFPLSSMTEEQKEDMIKSSVGIGSDKNVFDWFNKNHFDYRRLIEKGLAIDATRQNVY